MIYFANPTSTTSDAMASGALGYIDTPLQGNKRPDNVLWCADNGCFNDTTFNETRWWTWLRNHSTNNDLCYFATAPDVMGDAEATLACSTPWLPRIRGLGYPAAYVAQDDSDQHPPPWDDFDVLFLGGTNEFKLGPVARQLIAEARTRGKWVHCGRINSERRYKAMAALGCHSCDGTYLIFGPDINLPKLLGWIQRFHSQLPLFEVNQ